MGKETEKKEVSRMSTARVSTQVPFSKAEQDDTPIDVHTFVTEPASVTLSLGLTIPTGKFENAKVFVSATMPCYKEEMDDAFAYVKDWVESKVRDQSLEITRTIRDLQD